MFFWEYRLLYSQNARNLLSLGAGKPGIGLRDRSTRFACKQSTDGVVVLTNIPYLYFYSYEKNFF